MNRCPPSCLLAFKLTLTVSAVTATYGEQTTSIPLNSIFALNMPGTRDIRELEPESFGEHTRKLSSEDRFRLLGESRIDQIRTALQRDNPTKDGNAKTGFAVVGTGKEALDNAYKVLVKDAKRDTSFPFGSNITLVFFSKFAGQYVHLDRIQLRGNEIEVGYQAVPHITADSTWHLALIPVGELPIGKYEVEIGQVPGGKDKTGHFIGGFSASVAQRIVCRSFSFSIVERKDHD